jgi:plastocyanin/mono/diheme cytochrome c family protein
MIDPVQAIIGIVVLLIVVGAFLYLFRSRTNAVEKTGYGALIMLSLVSLMIPVFWIMESNGEAMAKQQQFNANVQRGAALYAQYCFQCHGTKGQGRAGPKLNNNPTVNALTDDDLTRIISGGIYDTANPTSPLMPTWSQDYGGPLTNTQIQYLVDLIRSSDPTYLAKNGYAGATNGFNQVPTLIQSGNPSGYATAVAQESSGQFGAPVDMTSKSAITINIINPPAGESCTPSCYQYLNVKVKVGTKITWVNTTTPPHTVTALKGQDVSNESPDKSLFDSGLTTPINTNGTFTWTVTTAAYNAYPNHTVIYYCEFHPAMLAQLTIVK